MLSRAKEIFKVAKQQREAAKVERYALLIAKIQITNSIPDDITGREFDEIATWDAIARRSTEIENDLRSQMGVTAVIDSSVALAPDGDEQ